MPTEVEIPGVGTVEFPDEMTAGQVTMQSQRLHQQASVKPEFPTARFGRRTLERAGEAAGRFNEGLKGIVQPGKFMGNAADPTGGLAGYAMNALSTVGEVGMAAMAPIGALVEGAVEGAAPRYGEEARAVGDTAQLAGAIAVPGPEVLRRANPVDQMVAEAQRAGPGIPQSDALVRYQPPRPQGMPVNLDDALAAASSADARMATGGPRPTARRVNLDDAQRAAEGADARMADDATRELNDFEIHQLKVRAEEQAYEETKRKQLDRRQAELDQKTRERYGEDAMPGPRHTKSLEEEAKEAYDAAGPPPETGFTMPKYKPPEAPSDTGLQAEIDKLKSVDTRGMSESRYAAHGRSIARLEAMKAGEAAGIKPEPPRPRTPDEAPVEAEVAALRDEYAGEREYAAGPSLSKFKAPHGQKILTKEFPEASRFARETATADVSARAAMAGHAADLKKAGITQEEFGGAMVESRLRGKKAQYSDLGKRAAADDLATEYETTHQFVVDELATETGKAGKAAKNVQELAEAGDWDAVRPALVDFYKTAGDIRPHIPEADYVRITSSPAFRAANESYQKGVGSELSRRHFANKGHDSQYVGEHGYYPLSGRGVKEPGKGGILGGRFSSRKPKASSSFFASGQKQYEHSAEALQKAVENSFRANSKSAMIANLEKNKVILPAGKVGKGKVVEVPETMTFLGEEVPTQRVDLGNGRVGYMPEPLAKELEPFFASSAPRDWSGKLETWKEIGTAFHSSAKKRDMLGVAEATAHAITKLALWGPIDNVFHITNVLGAAVVKPTRLGGALEAANLPFLANITKMPGIVAKMVTDKTLRWGSKEFQKDLQEMIANGEIHSKYLEGTISKRIAEEAGIKRTLNPLRATATGPAGIDVRARMILRRYIKSQNPDATPEQLYEASLAMGNYIHQLRTAWARKVTKTPLSPFYTAGSTAYRNGLQSFGIGGKDAVINALKPGDQMAEAVRQQLTGGAGGLLVTWIGTHRVATGMWPWEDDRARLFKIPTTVDEDGKQNYLSFEFTNPLVMRGARAIGLEAGFKSKMSGGDQSTTVNRIATQATNTALHPLVGPVPAAVAATAGIEPHVVSLFPREGQSRFLGKKKTGVGEAVEEATGSKFGGRFAERAAGVATNLNPLAEEAIPRLTKIYEGDAEMADQAAEYLMKYLFPRLMHSEDLEATQKHIDRENNQ